jgi:predicted acetylornithine/succinylornithine family transaminase
MRASMKSTDIISLYDQYVLPTYGRYPLAFVRGQGSRVWDADGRDYLDLGAGIAVDVLGHSSPVMTQAMTRQAETLVHTSNLYYTIPQGQLAKRLVELTGIAGKCFFCNSGGEANEALYKLARKHGNEHGGRHEIITFHNSFHGRTLAGISATGQDKVKKGFEPMVDGFRHVPFNDLDAVAQAIGPKTAAVLLEPIQGESGIRPATATFLRGLRQLCDQHNLLLMFDEVQCGVGRTGEFCAFRAIAPDVRPDAISWAKGLAGGFPIGAIWVREPFTNLLGPGSHASTFGGTPLACAVALAVLDAMERDNLMGQARDNGRYFIDQLVALSKRTSQIREVRGIGLMIGVELNIENKPVVTALAANGLLVIPAGTHVIRFLPAYTITRPEIDEAIGKLEKTLDQLDG